MSDAPELDLQGAREEAAGLRDENARLRRENARLRAQPDPPALDARAAFQLRLPDPLPAELVTSSSSSSEKVSLFRRLFRGREDVYAVRWERRDGRGGYSPAARSRWDRDQGVFLPLTDRVLREHLSGQQMLPRGQRTPDRNHRASTRYL
jgi:hypothetical protein